MYYLSDEMSQLVCSVSNQRTSSRSIATLVVFIFFFSEVAVVVVHVVATENSLPEQKENLVSCKIVFRGAK